MSKEDAIAAGKEAVKDKLTGNVVKEITFRQNCQYCYEIKTIYKSKRSIASGMKLN